jgi:serine/threonine protein kinase/Tol biopolymer transport system component
MTLVNQTISHYRIISQLGAGGMGEVYLAQDTTLDRKVALKVLPAEVASNRDRMERFVREAKSAAALNHPHIAHIYEIGESEGVNFIAMEYIDGETLREKIHRDKAPLPRLLKYLTQVAEGLSKAHSAGIVHRDLKPDNIMITRDGYAKILDFGLAKLVEPQRPFDSSNSSSSEVATAVMQQHSIPGMVMGTVGYMSPEQAQGKTREIDHRSDIFSFGCILFEAATGKKAFEGKDALDSLHKIVHAPTPQIKEINPVAPDELQRIVRRCLAKEPDKRYQSIKEVTIELEELQQELRTNAELEQSVQPQPNGERQQTSGALAGVASGSQLTAGPEVAEVRTVSSAEYVASAIKRHKTATVVGLASLAVVVTALAFGLYKLFWRKSAPFQSIKIVKLTNTGHVGTAAISPDGKYVAYTVLEGDQQSIWVLHVATKSNAQIVSLADVSYGAATFSSDSNYIYYMATVKGSPGELYQVPVLGGNPKKIIERVDTPISFGPGDKQFAFMRITQQAIQLIIANADGTGERMLTSTPVAGNHFFGPPAWSPDGRLIAYSYSVGESHESYMTVGAVSVADGTMKPLTSRRWRRVDRLAWLGDGSGLVSNVVDYSAPGPYAQIWYISYPDSSARRITNDTNNYGIGSLSITADSSAILSMQFEAFGNIFIAPADDVSRARKITSGMGRRDLLFSMSWTPDGRLVYTSLISGNADLWIMNADGTGIKQLTDSPTTDGDSAVSLDGRYIVFTSSRSGVMSIWRMDIDGGNQKPLTSGGPDYNPQISPDGRWVIYDRGFFGNLWKVSIEGGTPVRLTDKVSQSPAISPDGKFIACQYRENDNSQWRIAVIPFEGGSPIKLFDTSDRVSLPLRWSADGHAILYATLRGAAGKLWSQPVDGGPPKQLADFNPDQLFSFALSTDGRQLAFARGAVSRDIILITDSR